MLLPDQGIELVWEGRVPMLQQGRPGGELKRGQLKAGIKAEPPTIAKLQMVGGSITNLGGKGPMESALAIALQPLRHRAINQQTQLLTRRSPAMNPWPFQGMEAATAHSCPLAPQRLELPIALGIEPLGATTELHLPIGGKNKGPQHTSRTPYRQREGQGPLHQKTAMGRATLKLQLGPISGRRHLSQRPALSWRQQVLHDKAHLGRGLLIGWRNSTGPTTELAAIHQVIKPASPGSPHVGGYRQREAGRHGMGPSSGNDVHKLLMPHGIGLRDAGARNEGR